MRKVTGQEVIQQRREFDMATTQPLCFPRLEIDGGFSGFDFGLPQVDSIPQKHGVHLERQADGQVKV